MDKTSLGNRIKHYESLDCLTLSPDLPYVARLDGMSFSKWTKGLKKPFDENLTLLMQDVTKHLLEECNGEAVIGYTQSDEITLVFREGRYGNQWWGGRINKIVSYLTALTTYYFNTNNSINQKIGKRALFDCRVFQVPSRTEAVNAVLWREQDAVKNSIASLAQANFSHAQLKNKNTSQMQDMLMTIKGINWNDLEPQYKRGSYIQKVTTIRPYTVSELYLLPEKHEARNNPSLEYKRTSYKLVDMPILTKVINREEVFFENVKPITT